MADETYRDEMNDANSSYNARQQSSSTPYVRSRPAHRTVEPIDDYANQEGDYEQYVAHDSDYTIKGGGSGNSYRRSRASQGQLRRDLHYGQYLEVPKGRRDIFISRERKSRAKTIVALIVLLVVLVVVAIVVWTLLESTWGSASL